MALEALGRGPPRGGPRSVICSDLAPLVLRWTAHGWRPCVPAPPRSALRRRGSRLALPRTRAAKSRQSRRRCAFLHSPAPDLLMDWSRPHTHTLHMPAINSHAKRDNARMQSAVTTPAALCPPLNYLFRADVCWHRTALHGLWMTGYLCRLRAAACCRLRHRRLRRIAREARGASVLPVPAAPIESGLCDAQVHGGSGVRVTRHNCRSTHIHSCSRDLVYTY